MHRKAHCYIDPLTLKEIGMWKHYYSLLRCTLIQFLFKNGFIRHNEREGEFLNLHSFTLRPLKEFKQRILTLRSQLASAHQKIIQQETVISLYRSDAYKLKIREEFIEAIEKEIKKKKVLD